MRRRRTTPRPYTRTLHTVTLRARVLKSRRKRPRRAAAAGNRGLLGVAAVILALPLVAYGAHRLVVRLHQAPEYTVREVRVEGAQLFTPEEVVEKAGLKPGRPILDYRIYRARRALVRDPMIRDATILRELPDTLVIRLVERTPIAKLRSGRKEFLVDAEAYVLPASDAEVLATLPAITGVVAREPKPGTRLTDEKLRAALHILRLYAASSLPSLAQIESVDVRNLRNIRLYPAPGPKTRAGAVVLLGDAHFGQRIARLETILRAAPEPIKKLDLRLHARVPAETN